MGSYLTIVNDTNYEWQCKVGADMGALKWSVISAALLSGVGAGVGLGLAFTSTVATSVVAAGTGASSVALTVASGVGVAGVAASGGVSAIGLAVVKGIKHSLEEKGYRTISPGKERKYGRMTLSLWRQCECIRTNPIKSHKKSKKHHVMMTSLMMRPVFSGATHNSAREYSITEWIEKKGTKQHVIEATPKDDEEEESR